MRHLITYIFNLTSKEQVLSLHATVNGNTWCVIVVYETANVGQVPTNKSQKPSDI